MIGWGGLLGSPQLVVSWRQKIREAVPLLIKSYHLDVGSYCLVAWAVTGDSGLPFCGSDLTADWLPWLLAEVRCWHLGQFAAGCGSESKFLDRWSGLCPFVYSISHILCTARFHSRAVCNWVIQIFFLFSHSPLGHFLTHSRDFTPNSCQVMPKSLARAMVSFFSHRVPTGPALSTNSVLV